MDSTAPAPASDIEAPTTGQELVRAMRACTPKERKWLKALPGHDYQRYGTGVAIGISSRTVQSMLRRPRVQKALHLLETMAIEELGITHRRVLAGYHRLEQSDLRKLYHPDGRLKKPGEWDDETAYAIAEYYFDAQGLPRIKLHDKRGALDALAKIKQVQPPERHEHTGNISVKTQVVIFPDGGPGQANQPVAYDDSDDPAPSSAETT